MREELNHMGEISEGPKPVGRFERIIKDIGKIPRKLWIGNTLVGTDSASLVKPAGNRDAESAEVTASDTQSALTSNRLGIGQVNTEQPKTGGRVEPDERDGVRH